MTPVQLQKSLFLLSEKNNLKKDFYRFRPYDYGPFAPEIYRDAEQLGNENLITISYEHNLKWKVYAITPEGMKLSERIKSFLPDDLVQSIKDIIGHIRGLSFSDLVQEIYKEYPSYSVNSVFKASQ